MDGNGKLHDLDLSSTELVLYPDSVLREACTPVEKVDEQVRALVERMFEVMFSSRGVGLAAPQVGVTVRLFIASPTFRPDDRRVYINPEIVAVGGSQDGEEGCLSFPDISAKIRRYETATIRALNLAGEEFEESGHDLIARIYQHESDHLDGRLLVDRMGSLAKLAHRAALRELEETYRGAVKS